MCMVANKNNSDIYLQTIIDENSQLRKQNAINRLAIKNYKKSLINLVEYILKKKNSRGRKNVRKKSTRK